MLEAATAAIGGPSTDAASTVTEVEAAEEAAATAVAVGMPTSCTDCVGQSSGCGGGGCTLTASMAPGLPLGKAPAAQAETCQPPGWSLVHCNRVCLR